MNYLEHQTLSSTVIVFLFSEDAFDYKRGEVLRQVVDVAGVSHDSGPRNFISEHDSTPQSAFPHLPANEIDIDIDIGIYLRCCFKAPILSSNQPASLPWLMSLAAECSRHPNPSKRIQRLHSPPLGLRHTQRRRMF